MRVLITFLLIFICSCFNPGQVVEELGKGAYGRVVPYKTNDKVLKKNLGIFESKELKDYFTGLWHLRRERNRMSYLRNKPHPNVVNLLKYSRKRGGLVMERVDGESLDHAIRKILESGEIKQNSAIYKAFIKRIEREANAGLKHLNKNGIRHNDVYDRNIMLTRKTEDLKKELIANRHMTKEEATKMVNGFTEPGQPLVKVIDLGKSTKSFRPVPEGHREKFHVPTHGGF